MDDPTPPPFGDVTRRWTQLADQERARHMARLVGEACPSLHWAHVDRPDLDLGACYQQLVPAAAVGDEVAIGWLATSHRPLLVARGRAMLEHDPTEWGAVCLEVLHTTLAKANASAGRWLRRRVAQQLTSQLSRIVAQHVARRRREAPTAPAALRSAPQLPGSDRWDPHPELSLELDRALHQLDPATRDALYALAYDQPLAEIARRHGLSYAAVRQRVSRARRRLQPDLTTYRRAV